MTLILISAYYRELGNKDNKIDVKNKLEKFIVNDGLNMYINNHNIGFDPYPNKKKDLEITYQYNDIKNTLILLEDQHLVINKNQITYESLYQNNTNELNIISAEIKVNSTITDVTNMITNKIIDKSILKINSKDLLPEYNKYNLYLKYKINDLFETILVPYNQTIQINSKMIQYNPDYNTKPIYIYFHICAINNWQEVVKNSLNYIKFSFLYYLVKEIRCCILGDLDEIPDFLRDKKIRIVKKHKNIKRYERITLRKIYSDSQSEDFYGFYLHSKGVSDKYKKRKINWGWINNMLVCNCYNCVNIIKLLDKYDTIGTRYKTKEIGPHYSGNFWWFTSRYLKNKSNHIGVHYLDPERWILIEMSKSRHLNINEKGKIQII